ncbi:MAG: hypothetical protein IT449_04195 [Phycisphaerales bacterium]|nr:hypothetical protein [Phycisphaerales bacterium]
MGVASAAAGAAVMPNRAAGLVDCAAGLSDCTARDVQVNAFEVSAQESATLAIDAFDRVFVAWESRRQEGGNYGVYGRFLDLAGRPLSDELRINATTDNAQWRPAVCADGLGGVIVVWESIGQDGDMGGIVARRLDGGTLAASPEIAVNRTARGHQSEASAASRADGAFAVVWSGPTSSGPRGVFVRRFEVDGLAATNEVALPCVSDGPASCPTIAALADGRWVVAWASADESNRPCAVYAARLNDAMQIEGEPFVVGDTTGQDIEPSVAADATGGFAVAWMRSEQGEYAVCARRFRADGEPMSDAQVISASTRPGQSGATVAFAADGRLLAAWNAESAMEPGGSDVLARWLTPKATAEGEPFQLTAQSQKSQRIGVATGAARLGLTHGGGIVCAWSGSGGRKDETAAHVTLLPGEGDAVPGERVAYMAFQLDAEGSAAADTASSAIVAGPHIPPTFNPDDVAQDPFGGDLDPSPAGGDFGFIGVVNTGWTPPDPHSAVGPTHVVLMTNGNISIYTKSGTQTFTDQIEGAGGFWGSVGATDFIFDPEVIYDELSGRFFAMAAEGFAPGNKSYALVAVSDDSDPNGTWYKYRFETTALAGDLFDSPNIGVDDEAMYITGDGFGFSANYPVYTFDKASLLAGNDPVIRKSFALSTSTQSAGIPPVSFGNPPAYYMIEHQEGSNRTQVRLIALRDPLGTPTTTTFQLTVPAYSDPGDPPQMGTSVRPNTFDSRFWSVEYRNGSLWATHHINSSPVKARWYEIAMNDWPTSGQNPALVQSGDIDLGGTVHAFFTSIGVDENNNAALCFNRSASNEFISICRAYRLAGDALGTMGNLEIVKASGGGSTSGRFGDYSSIDADPVQGSFWLHHEYSPSGGSSWNTWVARVDVAASVPCADIKALKANCKASGKIVAKVVLFDTSHDGQTVTVAIDGTPTAVTISGSRAVHKPCCFTGAHTVTLEDPAGCKPAVNVSCP